MDPVVGDQMMLRLSPYSALYLPHSDTVVLYKDGDDLGFIRVAQGLLCVTTGEPEPPELRAVADAYRAAHAEPEDDPCLIVANEQSESPRTPCWACKGRGFLFPSYLDHRIICPECDKTKMPNADPHVSDVSAANKG